MRLLSMLAIGLIALAGCTSSEPQGDGLLAVLVDGHVVVMDSAGENRVDITDTEAAPTERAFYFQPTWSPDGSQIAFSRISPNTGLHIATGDGEKSWSIDTQSLPFYFSWSVDNELALLRNADLGSLSLDLTSPASTDLRDLKELDTGAPLYFSWSPDGTRMVTHIGQDRLDVNDLTSTTPLGPPPGAFLAPQWTDRGIFAVEGGSDGQRFTVIDPDGVSRPIARLLGPASFVATDDGTRVAIQTRVTDIDGASAAYQEMQTVAPNRVVVIETDSGTHTTATDEPAIAFFWSPQGDKLLLLDVDETGTARWTVWADGELSPAISFQLEGSFLRDFLPFFNQYAQSMSLWSPDGEAFAFPGTIDGESGIWVRRGDDAPVRISDGTWVAWSK